LGVKYASLLNPQLTRRYLSNREEKVNQIRKVIAENSIRELEDLYFRPNLEDDELQIETMAHGRPLTMFIEGVIVAMVAAVILSGGTVRIGPAEFKVPPVATGIHELARLFHTGGNTEER
jgi:hypothetical protein